MQDSIVVTATVGTYAVAIIAKITSFEGFMVELPASFLDFQGLHELEIC